MIFGGPMASKSIFVDAKIKHILVVDDETSLLPVISQSLRKAGFCVWQARHPISALDMAANGIPAMDLLLTDVLMPRYTGTQLADRLRDFFPYMGTLYMSDLGQQHLGNLGLQIPDWQILFKPFSSEDLVQKVKAAVTAASETDELHIESVH